MPMRSLLMQMVPTARCFGMAMRRMMAPVFFFIGTSLAALLPVSLSFAQSVSFALAWVTSREYPSPLRSGYHRDWQA